ncbi:hypothetical protein DUY81_05955 [Acidipropionibacterium acidipropionici]|nr:hypothetical protein DUY81_05955 [Acidipropionibacterium acidipropionici]
MGPGGLSSVVEFSCVELLFCCGVTAPAWLVGLTVDLRGRTPAFLPARGISDIPRDGLRSRPRRGLSPGAACGAGSRR